MTGPADAALLAVVAIGCVRGSAVLGAARWPRRSPGAAILLWQALGLGGGLAAVRAVSSRVRAAVASVAVVAVVMRSSLVRCGIPCERCFASTRVQDQRDYAYVSVAYVTVGFGRKRSSRSSSPPWRAEGTVGTRNSPDPCRAVPKAGLLPKRGRKAPHTGSLRAVCS